MKLFELVLVTIAFGAPLTSDEPVIKDAKLAIKGYIKPPVFAEQSKGKFALMIQGRVMSINEIYIYSSMIIVFGVVAIMII